MPPNAPVPHPWSQSRYNIDARFPAGKSQPGARGPLECGIPRGTCPGGPEASTQECCWAGPGWHKCLHTRSWSKSLGGHSIEMHVGPTGTLPAARSKHMPPRSWIAHGRFRSPELPTASGASRAGQNSPGLQSGLCLGPLFPLSMFINNADYHSNGCYPNNNNIVRPVEPQHIWNPCFHLIDEKTKVREVE